MRIVIVGNSGSGKTTMARALAEDGAAVLELDAIAWDPGVVRRPLERSIADLEAFVRRHERWVVEGCYGELAACALVHADELRWLDPGTDACQERCLRRPFEPAKFATPEEQDAALDGLLAWVREYDVREDEFGRPRHRALFDAFPGRKRVYGPAEGAAEDPPEVAAP